MENLIKVSDFKAPIKVFATNENLNARINDLISYAQEHYLIWILGKLEYDKLASADLETNTAWQRFVNGHSYDLSGTTYYYKGIKDPLKHLLFYDILTELHTDPIPHGYSQAEYEEGRKVFPAVRAARSYNHACDLIYDYEKKFADYPTVYRFLTDFENDYPDLLFRPIKKMNPFL